MRPEHPRNPSIEPLESRQLLTAVALADLALTEGPAYTVSDTTSAVMGGAVYMAVNRDTLNTELWRSDGTPGGATMVKSIFAFQSTSADAAPAIANFTVVGSTLFFTVGQTDLWASDGTAAGTAYLTNVSVGSSPQFGAFGGRLYFTAEGSSRSSLWTSDGTPQGTFPVGSYSSASQLSVDGDTLYFAASDGIYKMVAGGTPSTVRITTNTPVTGRSMVVAGGVLYFIARDASTATYKLFRYAGSGTPTALATFASPTTSPEMAAMGGRVYFKATAPNGGSPQDELWQSDGTVAGTRLLKDINPTTSSRPSQLTAAGDLLYFTADDGTHGVELWRTDGTDAGTFLVSDLEPGTTSGAPSRLTNVGGRLFFNARTAAAGSELWRTDGTDETTVRVTDLYAGGGSSAPRELIADGDTLYFQAVDSRTGYGLFAVGRDGGGITLLKDYIAGPMNGTIDRAVMADGRLVFAAGDGTLTGRELYLSDGTPAGTGLLKNILTTAWASSVPTSLTRVGDTVYFSASSSANVGAELWKTDGTAAGTILVKDIRPNTGVDRGSTPRSLIDFNGTLYFVADDGTNGKRLYSSDGTGPGTVMIAATEGVSYVNLNTLFTWDGLLYFFPNTNVLQRYDGTSASPRDGAATEHAVPRPNRPGHVPGLRRRERRPLAGRE